MDIEATARRNTKILTGIIITVAVTVAYLLGQLARGF